MFRFSQSQRQYGFLDCKGPFTPPKIAKKEATFQIPSSAAMLNNVLDIALKLKGEAEAVGPLNQNVAAKIKLLLGCSTGCDLKDDEEDDNERKTFIKKEDAGDSSIGKDRGKFLKHIFNKYKKGASIVITCSF